MSDARSYVASFVEEGLGLAEGTLAATTGEELLPSALVDRVTATLMSGVAPPGCDSALPYLEKEMMALLPRIRDVSLQSDGYFVRKARWPNASPLAVCLTHDVDNIARPFEHVWKTRNRFTSTDVLGAAFGKTLYQNVDEIATAEATRGFRSSFYLMSSEYPLASIAAVSRDIRSRGWDVGLHGDFGTHDSLEKMTRAISRFSEALGFQPSGVREHYLRFDFAKTWDVMQAAGFDYDTTVGNNDRLGFRVGMASPFHPPSRDWQPLNLLEVPLTLMDTTLWGYLRRTEGKGYEDFEGMMAAVEEVEGLFTLLWHQEAVRMKGGRLYWRILDAIKAKGCFVGSGAHVSAWWRARSVPMVRRGNLISFAEAPPAGLVLRITASDGRAPRVTSGSLRELRDGEYLASVEGPGFSVEVVT